MNIAMTPGRTPAIRGMIAGLLSIMLCGCTKNEAANAPTPDIAKLAAQTQRVLDAAEVANLMGLYVHFNRNGMNTDTVGLFAIDDPEVAAEFPGEGRYVGRDEVAKRLTWYERMQRAQRPEFYGRFVEHALVSPIIVVADDGLTAKGLWSRLGYEAVNISRSRRHPDVVAMHSLGKYAVDFKKIHGQWKIWHLHAYPTFTARAGDEWTDKDPFHLPSAAIPISDAAPATRNPSEHETGWYPPHATRDNEPYWSYSAEQPYPPREQPRAPRPYATWAATFSY